MKRDLNDRLFDFSLCVFKFLPSLPNTPELKVIRYQLAKSASSEGANYEEPQAGSSRADYKIIPESLCEKCENQIID